IPFGGASHAKVLEKLGVGANQSNSVISPTPTNSSVLMTPPIYARVQHRCAHLRMPTLECSQHHRCPSSVSSCCWEAQKPPPNQKWHEKQYMPALPSKPFLLEVTAFAPKDGCLNFIEENDEVLAAGFGCKGHAVVTFLESDLRLSKYPASLFGHLKRQEGKIK
ncbi:40S ribosomal protein S23, partial [Galemys pyrenaicus]